MAKSKSSGNKKARVVKKKPELLKMTPVERENVLPDFKPALAETDRLTVIHEIHHDTYSEGRVSAISRYDVFLETREQPFQRIRMKIGEEWAKLNFGWLEEISCFSIDNRAGTEFIQNPTEEQMEETRRKVVQFALLLSGSQLTWDVHPGKTKAQIMPNEPADVYARCMHGETYINLIAFPK